MSSPASPPPRSTRTRKSTGSPTKESDGGETASPTVPSPKKVKKETFQWSTPADEFADDVASDVEESEDEGGGRRQRGRVTSGSGEASHVSEVTNGQVDESPIKREKKTPKKRNQFPCPKCNKVWNWPWELRRHLVMHFKEASLDFTKPMS